MKNSDIDRITGDLNRAPGGTVSAETWSDLSAAITATDPAATGRPTLVTSTNPTPGNAGAGRPVAEVPVAEVSGGRAAAFAADSKRRRSGRPRRLMLVAAMVAITVGVVGATALPSRHDQPRALSFTESGDKIIVRIVDPNADAKQYTKDFRAMGLKIKVRMVPVSPSLVGTMAGFSFPDERSGRHLRSLEAGEKCNGTLTAADPGCQEGVEVDKNFKGWAVIDFGRAAKPGEMYQASPSDATDPGEELAGLKLKNRRVSEVLPLLAARGVRAGTYQIYHGTPQVESRESVPGDWYVHSASPHMPGVVLLWVDSTPDKSR